jgi:hypothetical protein
MGMVWDLDLPPNKRLVLLAYADHADHDGGSVYPSLARIAHKTGYSRRQVIRVAQQLIEDGLMVRVREATATAPAEYRLHLERGVKMSPLRGGVVTSEHDRGDKMSPEPSLEPSVSTPNGVEAGASPGTFCQYLREELDGADVPLLRGREDRYGGDFKKHIAKGVTADLLYRACDRIVERWTGDEHRKLTVEQALADVVNGKAPRHADPDASASATPERGVRSVAQRVDLRRYVPLLEKWDFTRPEDPPWTIRQDLGGTDDERQRNLTRIRSLVGQQKHELSEEAKRLQEENERLTAEILRGVV